MFARYIHFFKNILSKIGLNDNISNFIAEAISFVTLILVTILIYYAVALRHVDDTILMAESEEELNRLLMKVKEE